MLNETMGISKTIMKKIQAQGMTLVRTLDPIRRKMLTIILDSVLKI